LLDKTKSTKVGIFNNFFPFLTVFQNDKFEDGGQVAETLQAPNGKPTNLTPQQYALVRTPAFKKWFGDWENDPTNASKVVDENGEPLVVYHGTNREFNIFSEKGKGNRVLGFFFTSDINFAEIYGMPKACFLNIKKPKKYDSIRFYSLNTKQNAESNYWDNVKNKLLEERHDGVIIEANEIFAGEKIIKKDYVSFESNQIKLAEGTNTKFDPNMADIRFEEGGQLHFVSSKSLTIKIGKDFYKIQYRRGERGDTEKKVWFAKVIFKNRMPVDGCLCSDPMTTASTIYGFSLPEVEDDILYTYKQNDLYLIIEDDYGNPKEKRHIEYTNSLEIRFEEGGQIEHLLAPNGQPSNLTLEQYALVRTPAFKAWFGDWENDAANASKVVDENGEPLVVYHGTNREFNVFGEGVNWFSTKGSLGKKYTCFLKIKKVKVLDANTNRDYNRRLKEEVLEEIAANNFDGVLILNKRQISFLFDDYITEDQFLTFRPTQIKLADGTNITFDPNTADIRFEDGGELNTILLLKNKVKAPKLLGFGQDVEPAGYYAIKKVQNFFDSNPDYETVEVTYLKPLVIPVTPESLFDWKYELSKKYKAKGKALTAALRKDGYDIIITKYKEGDTGEIVVLDTSKIKRVPLMASPDKQFSDGGIIESGTYYRGGGEGSFPNDATLADVLEFEKEELGNEDVFPMEGIDPSTVSTRNLIWVTKYKHDAKEYGNVEKHEFARHRLVARDSNGGYILEELPMDSKPNHFAAGGEIVDHAAIYKKWKSLVNMTRQELREFSQSQEGKEAGLSKPEADKLGIHNGQESARWIMKMKATPHYEWTDEMWGWAKRQIAFISRMSGNKGELYDEDGNKTRKHTSLLIWGHNPMKKATAKNNGTQFALGGSMSNTNPTKPAYLMTLAEYQATVTPIIQAYNKFIRKNEQYFAKADYQGLFWYSFPEAVSDIENDTIKGHIFRRLVGYDDKKSAIDHAKGKFNYAKTRNSSIAYNFTPLDTPQSLIDEKNKFISMLSEFFTQDEIISRIQEDETKSNKRAVRRAIDDGVYSNLLNEGKVTIEQVREVAESVGITLPKKTFDASVQKAIENQAIYEKILAGLPKINFAVLVKMINTIKESLKPLEEEIYAREDARYRSLIAEVLAKKEMFADALGGKIPFYGKMFSYKSYNVRTQVMVKGRLRDSEESYLSDIALLPIWESQLDREIKLYVESLKASLIQSIASNFKYITMPISDIKQLALKVGAKGFEASYKFNFENGSHFIYNTEAIGAGGYNIQCFHYRYINNFTDVTVADGSTVSNRTNIANHFSAKTTPAEKYAEVIADINEATTTSDVMQVVYNYLQNGGLFGITNPRLLPKAIGYKKNGISKGIYFESPTSTKELMPVADAKAKAILLINNLNPKFKAGGQIKQYSPSKIQSAIETVSYAPSVKYWMNPEFRAETYKYPKVGEPNSFVFEEKAGTQSTIGRNGRSVKEEYRAKDVIAYDSNGDIVGAISVLQTEPKGAFKIVVREDAFRQGWGFKLLDAAEANGIDIIGGLHANSFTQSGRALLLAWLNKKVKN
jgi:hypothetical protein